MTILKEIIGEIKKAIINPATYALIVISFCFGVIIGMSIMIAWILQ
jgi:hypothetical protein